VHGFRRAGKQLIVGALGVALLLVPASPALAAHQDGAYAGATEQGEAVTFRALEGRVKRFSVVVYAECEKGPRHKVTVEAGRNRLDGGRFSIDLTGDDGLSVSIEGKLRDRTATGNVEATLKPSGTTCTAATGWSARLLPADGAAKP
jgi:hypothetical protein